jgi:hypothetical protein
VRVQEVGGDRGGSERVGDHAFSYGNGIENHALGIGYFVYNRAIPAVKGDRISHVILRSCWYDIVLNIHAPTEDKTYDTKGSFYDKLKCVFE